jgi:hypothetical protein
MQTTELVKAALKDKNPALHKQLTAKGELNKFATDLAEQINSQAVTLTQADRVREGWDKLGPVESAARMRTANSLNREAVMAEMLEFPQDETSLQKPDETTPSDPTT